MVGEVEVAGFVEGHEVDVDMRHIDTHHSLADLDAGTDFLKSLGDALGKEMELGKEVVVEVEDIIHFLLGYAGLMSRKAKQRSVSATL